MAGFGVFIGFGFPVRGREEGATKVFQELVAFLAAQSQQGSVESFEPVFLQPHGGDLGGFFIVRGDREKLAGMTASQEFQRITLRAQTIVESVGIVNCTLGDEVQRQMANFLPDTADLR